MTSTNETPRKQPIDSLGAKVLDVIVIGAGPAGLLLTKRLAQTESNFLTIERNSDVGGIWDIDAPGSPMYETAHFISSRTQSGFPNFPMPDDYPDYPNHRQLLAYIRDYAEHHDLRKHIKFGTEVIAAKQRADTTWEISLAGGQVLLARYLITANGVTWEPNVVTWPGIEDFEGEVRHSVTYRSPKEFEGKRVMIVGCGNSGVDIACDAAFTAEQAFLSTRRGYHFVPKHIMGLPTDVFAKTGPKLPFKIQQILFSRVLRFINGRPEKYGLPTPDHKLFESHPLMNTQILHYLGHGDCIAKPGIERFEGKHVLFTDGTTEEIDLIITATGYKHASPFLPMNAWEEKRGRPDLYLRMFSKNYDNLAVLGFLEFSSAAYANFDAMAELIVADATSPRDSETSKKMNKLKLNHDPDLKAGHKYINTARHANYVDVDAYLKTLDQVKRKIGIGTQADENVTPPKGDKHHSE